MMHPNEYKSRAGFDESKVEATLDRVLAQHAATSPSRPIRIDMRILGERPTVAIVLDRYRSAGWSVSIVSDPRDGDYVEMAP